MKEYLMNIQRLRRRPQARALQDVPLFSRCSRSELRRIDSLTVDIYAQAGRSLTVTHQPGTEFFVILQGTATVSRRGVQLDTIGPGSFFGELALLDYGRRTATVIADTDMKLLVLSLQEFHSPHFLIPPVLEQMLAVISERLRRANEGWTDNRNFAELGSRLG
jgi:CRP/FNR family cyclic AMP-dependent transcriptional regulator